MVLNYCKSNKKMDKYAYKFTKNIELPLKIGNDKTINFCKWCSQCRKIKFCRP